MSIRKSLTAFLAEHGKSAPSFIRNKLTRVIVDIARSDWPHFYPEFVPEMFDLISRPETTLLGLNLLLIASEELATPRDDLPTARKQELLRLLNSQVPQVCPKIKPLP